jgi:nucleoside-diphosphate-sugar epimerase
VYHLAESADYEWGEILELMARAMGRTGKLIPVPRSILQSAGVLSGVWGRVSRKPRIFDRDKVRELLAPGWLCETDRAREDLGFTASVPLERGLKQTAAWYRSEGWIR